MFTRETCLLPKKSLQNLDFLPTNSMYFSNKKGCLYSNQATSWKAGKDCRRGGRKKKHKTTRSLFNRKQNDGSGLEFHRKDKQALTGMF